MCSNQHGVDKRRGKRTTRRVFHVPISVASDESPVTDGLDDATVYSGSPDMDMAPVAFDERPIYVICMNLSARHSV